MKKRILAAKFIVNVAIYIIGIIGITMKFIVNILEKTQDCLIEWIRENK